MDPAAPSARDLLANVWLFAELDERELNQLARVTLRRRWDVEAVVLRQGDKDADLYVVVEGLLRVTRRGKDGREFALNLLRPGDVFGELSLLDGLTRSASITAIQSSLLLVVRRQEFVDVLNRSPALAIRLLTSMAGHVRRLTERANDLSSSVSSRLAKKLLELGELCGTALGPNQMAMPLSLSQQDLADHVQATRESVNKCIASWVREGILQRTQSQIVVQDKRRLAACIDTD